MLKCTSTDLVDDIMTSTSTFSVRVHVQTSNRGMLLIWPMSSKPHSTQVTKSGNIAAHRTSLIKSVMILSPY